MTLIDSNILLDIVTDDAVFAAPSLARLEAASLTGPLVINDIVYAELSVRYPTKEALDAFVQGVGLRTAPLTPEALFLAGKAFLRYRKAGGTRTGVLPDFFIGAHAAVTGLNLMTRDVARYRTYFPTVSLV